MSCVIRSGLLVMLLAIVTIPCQAQAAGEAQADLERAMTMKRNARTTGDLGQVIRLLDGALEEGLEEGHADFAKSLLAASLIERGSHYAAAAETASTMDILVGLRAPALDDLERAVDLSPNQPQALLWIAKLNLLPGGDAPRGQGALERAIELTEEQPQIRAEALMVRAGIETDPNKKLADLTEAIRIMPENLEGLRSRAQLHAEMGMTEEALADLDLAISIMPEDAATLRERARLRAVAGKLEEALADFDKAIELEPRDENNYLDKVTVLKEMKRYDEALVALDKVQELTPRSVVPRVLKAELHIMQSNLDAALHELNRANTMAPENVAVLLLRAQVHLQKGEEEEALADSEAALDLDPNIPGAVQLRAALLADSGKRDEAIALLEELRKSAPVEPSLLMQLGVLYSVNEDYEHAANIFAAALAKNPNEPTALRGHGDALLNLGKHKEALADFEALVKLRPDDHGALNNLAWVLATSPMEELRDGKRAVELATEACELTEYKAAYILSTLAAAYAEMGEFSTAVDWIEKGLEIAEEEDEQPLRDELKSYREGKPWRELLSEGRREESSDESP